MQKHEIKSAASGLRLPGIGLLIAAAATSAVSLLMRSDADGVNVLVASALLAMLGGLLIAVSLAAYLYEARDVASLQALAREAGENLAAARQMARKVRDEREENSLPRHEIPD